MCGKIGSPFSAIASVPPKEYMNLNANNATRVSREQFSPWSSPSTSGKGLLHMLNSIDGTMSGSNPRCAGTTATSKQSQVHSRPDYFSVFHLLAELLFFQYQSYLALCKPKAPTFIFKSVHDRKILIGELCKPQQANLAEIASYNDYLVPGGTRNRVRRRKV